MFIDNATSLLPSLERAAKEAYAAQMPLLLAIHGIPVRHKRQMNRQESKVYGQFAGVPEKVKLIDFGPQKILMSSAQWRAVIGDDSGYFDDNGYIYCNFDLYDGDILEITRDDKSPISFRVINTQSLGVTTGILKRFTMSNLGGD